MTEPTYRNAMDVLLHPGTDRLKSFICNMRPRVDWKYHLCLLMLPCSFAEWITVGCIFFFYTGFQAAAIGYSNLNTSSTCGQKLLNCLLYWWGNRFRIVPFLICMCSDVSYRPLLNVRSMCGNRVYQSIPNLNCPLLCIPRHAERQKRYDCRIGQLTQRIVESFISDPNRTWVFLKMPSNDYIMSWIPCFI